MKKVEVLLDLPNDRARIKGTWTNLIVSVCDHYGINMLPKSKTMETFKGLVTEGYDKNERDVDREEEMERGTNRDLESKYETIQTNQND